MLGKKLVCQTDQHNKVWQYDVSGLTVTFKWGRIGGGSEQQVKTFDSASDMHEFIDKKVREKMKKGYVETTSEELREDVKVAETMGFRYKISKLQFVEMTDARGDEGQEGAPAGDFYENDVKLTFLPTYDHKQWIYAQILDSWSKNTTFLLLNKTLSYVFYPLVQYFNPLVPPVSPAFVVGTKEAAVGRPTSFNGGLSIHSSLVAGVRLAIKKLTAAVVETYQRLQLGVVGARVLDDFQFTENLDMQELANSAGATSEAVSSFASGLYATGQLGSLGVRVIDLD